MIHTNLGLALMAMELGGDSLAKRIHSWLAKHPYTVDPGVF